MENNWYDIINPEENISQGDILFNCPLFIPFYPKGVMTAFDFDKIEGHKLETEIKRANVIVLNQSCDLEVRDGKESPKLSSILVATLQDVRKTQVGKNKTIPIGKFEKTELFLLEPSFHTVTMGYQIVHFDYSYTLPWDLLNAFSKTRGKRLRLRSPYLESLSSHFGRVAIPENREKTVGTYYSIKDRYDAERISAGFKKMWHELSEEEVLSYWTKVVKEETVKSPSH